MAVARAAVVLLRQSMYVKIDHTIAHQIYATVFPSFKTFSNWHNYLQSDNEKIKAIP